MKIGQGGRIVALQGAGEGLAEGGVVGAGDRVGERRAVSSSARRSARIA
jgi:hypothetical protein